LLEGAIPLAEDSGQPFVLAAVYYSLSELYVRQGRISKAIPVLERAFALGLAKNLHVYVPGLQSLLGLVRCRTGLITDGIALLEESAREWQKVVSGHGAFVLSNLSEGYLLAGRAADAVHAATRALELARSRKEKGNEAWALHMLGEVSSHPDLPDFRVAETHYRQTSKQEQAREYLTTAKTTYRELDMQSWLEKAESALKSF